MRNKSLFLIAASVALTFPAMASDNADWRRMSAISSQTEFLRAEIQREILEQELKDLRESRDKSAAPVQATQEPEAPPFIPMVRAVEGIGSDRVAILILENGGRMEVRAGDLFPDGGRITDITPNRVTMLRDGASVTLPFSSGEVVPPNR